MVVNLAGNSSNQGDKMKHVIFFPLSLFFIFNCCGNVKVEMPERSDNGQIEAIEKLKDEKEDGLFTFWHENGQKSEEGTYKDGVEDGKWIGWRENGQKDYEGTLKDGEQIEETYWDEDGNVNYHWKQ